jgi:hypothetical protein
MGLILLTEGGSRRRMRFCMGRPDGLLAGFGDSVWLYQYDRHGLSSGYCIAEKFSEEGMTGWDLLFALK